MKVFYFTNRGNYRDKNEDALLIDKKVIQEDMEKPRESAPSKIVAVADGVGGAAAGEVASKSVLETLADFENPDIEAAIFRAKEKLKKLAEKDPSLNGMATTVAGIKVESNKITVFNCGDSRVYKKAGKFLRILSFDHSKGGVLYSAVGTDITPEVFTRQTDGGIFLIATDGFYGVFEEQELEELFEENIEKTVSNIMQKLKTKNLHDNTTFIIAEV
ncbi:protein phosphatase 2C domain-containing protein [Persephonella sp. KM09-Lau-8]|uniref:PP2C family protein-serine/threonine phosphatase n=1 Tax=Persephonella sp. KM09-Lau-8 TaxID=1158345 RepID=UPI00068FE345|nr:protein phosphatase 2C domain-containing protein [Persephonella sp. KM09-Lau-8]